MASDNILSQIGSTMGRVLKPTLTGITSSIYNLIGPAVDKNVQEEDNIRRGGYDTFNGLTTGDSLYLTHFLSLKPQAIIDITVDKTARSSYVTCQPVGASMTVDLPYIFYAKTDPVYWPVLLIKNIGNAPHTVTLDPDPDAIGGFTIDGSATWVLNQGEAVILVQQEMGWFIMARYV
jgi:hypothetical protein